MCRRFVAEVKVDAADRHVHRRKFPDGRVRLLAIGRDIALLLSGVVILFASMLFNKAISGDEKSTRSHRRVIDAPIVGLQHFENQGNDAFRRIVLTTLLTFSQRELAKKIFVNVAENIFDV